MTLSTGLEMRNETGEILRVGNDGLFLLLDSGSGAGLSFFERCHSVAIVLGEVAIGDAHIGFRREVAAVASLTQGLEVS